MIDQVEDGVLLVVNDALSERLAFHGESTRGVLPDDVDRTPSTDLEGYATRVN
jgi:hypothetical protein